MPLYEYVCTSCRNDFEALVSSANRDNPAQSCPKCGAAKVARKISLMAQPVVKSGAREGGGSFDCGAPGGCCGGACGLD